MTAHKHAALMAQYVQDALETDQPWTRWEFRLVGAETWRDCTMGVGFSVDCEYRRKPRKPRKLTYTVTIPEPLREAPHDGKVYFVPNIASTRFYFATCWDGGCVDNFMLERGLCFATKEDAIAAAIAMLPVKGGVQ